MGKMTVYHGSNIAIPYPEIRISRNTKDFGPGFYCTILREQAERWAQRYDIPVVNTYTVRLDTNLKILEFREMTEAWLDFIINCRHGTLTFYKAPIHTLYTNMCILKIHINKKDQ